MAHEEFTQQFPEAGEEFRTFMEEKHGVKPDWTFESLPAVDDFLTAVRPELETPEDRQALVALAGAFFGELYVRNWGCSWHCEGNPEELTNWSICINGLAKGPSYVRVFRRVQKFVEHGPSESLFALYQNTYNYRERNLVAARPSGTPPPTGAPSTAHGSRATTTPTTARPANAPPWRSP